MAKHPQYTARQSSGYVFRLRLPRQAGPGEVRFSLKTSDKLLASRRASDVALRIKEALSNMAELTREQIKELVSEYVREALSSIQSYTIHRREVDPDEYERNLEGLALYNSEFRESLALNRLESVQADVDSILRKHGLAAGDELRQELSHALLSARVELADLEEEVLQTGSLRPLAGLGEPQPQLQVAASETLSEDWKPGGKNRRSPGLRGP